MKLNKKVVESLVVCGLCTFLTITAVTNSEGPESKAEDKVLANTGLENLSVLDDKGYAGVAAALAEYEKSLEVEQLVTIEKDEIEMVSTPVEMTPEEQEWQSKLMPCVEDYLNVRQEASEDATVVGKLYKGNVAEIIEAGAEWTHIVSGNVDGYVKNEFCKIGTEALEYAYQVCGKVAVVNTDGLRIRAEQSQDSKVINAVAQGTSLAVDSSAQTQDGWVAVVYNSQTRFVSSDYVMVSLNTGVGITIEEELAQIAAQKAAEEKAAAEAAAKEAAAKETKKVKVSQGTAVEAQTDDLTLLAAIIDCEAGGESYECQLAVGAAIINRVKSSSYPNSISGVVYQRGQFGPASSGKLARKLQSGKIGSNAYSAAQAALSGVDNIGGLMSFNGVSSGISGLVIGRMVFH